jgi:lysocardiolipin and lysophospholipid acyltransferase
MHWRRFSTASLPTDEKEFGDWLLARWREKDDLIEHFIQTGRFPADSDTSPNINGQKQLKGAGYIETSVRPNNPLEFLQIFVPVAALALVVNVCVKFLNMILRTLRLR